MAIESSSATLNPRAAAVPGRRGESGSEAAADQARQPLRHIAVVRVTHWIMAAGVLARSDGQTLREASSLYHRVTQVLRLCVSGAYDPATSPAGLNRIVASAAACPDIAAAEALLLDTQADAARLFDSLIGSAG